MPPTNDFVPFCPTDTGTNLLSQSDYLAAPDLAIGNQPGVASSQLVNKALRQATFMAAALAQYIANKTSTNTNDNANEVQMLSQIFSAVENKSPVVTQHLSGSGNHNLSYKFQITSGNATLAATYTNNGVTYTVTKTIAAGLELVATGSGAPTTSGTLTKASGTGDATLTFNAVRAPQYIRVLAIAGGGGGGGAGLNTPTTNGAGGNGGNTTFGTSLIVCTGGSGAPAASGGVEGGSGGGATAGSGPLPITVIQGSSGCGNQLSTVNNIFNTGGGGGSSFLSGAGGGGCANAVGATAVTNSGSGGGGGGSGQFSATNYSGAGGGAGGFVDCIIIAPLSTYAWSVGTAGTNGTAGTSGSAGGAGGSGSISVIEYYQ